MAHTYASHDFNHDLYSDIVWRSSSGDIALWAIRDDAVIAAPSLGRVPANLHFVSSGDLNGDLTTDIVWHNQSTGLVSAWFFSNLQASNTDIYAPSPAEWTPVDYLAGYYNADGYQDIIFQQRRAPARLESPGSDDHRQRLRRTPAAGVGNSAPSRTATTMATAAATSCGKIPPVATWRSGSWTTRPCSPPPVSPAPARHGGLAGPATITPTAGPTSSAYADGRTGIWYTNGTAITGSVDLGNPGAQWRIASTGYYNNDDYTDILWRNTQDGSVAIWNLQGGQVIANVPVGVIGAEWQILI